MSFFSTLFGGPSSQQTALASQAENLASTMNNAFSQRLGAQNQIYQNLNQTLQPIQNLGPGQRGGSPEQWAAENTLAINSAAANARNARQAVSTQLAGQGGGGTSGQISGIQQQIAGTIASNAENQLSNETEQNLVHQYDVGNQDFWKATQGEQTLGNAEDALQFGGEASSTGQSALQDANQIESMKQSELGNIVGLAGKVIGAPLTGGASLLGGLSTSSTEGGGLIGGLQNAFSGGKNAGNGTGGFGANFLSGFQGDSN